MTNPTAPPEPSPKTVPEHYPRELRLLQEEIAGLKSANNLLMKQHPERVALLPQVALGGEIPDATPQPESQQPRVEPPVADISARWADFAEAERARLRAMAWALDSTQPYGPQA